MLASRLYRLRGDVEDDNPDLVQDLDLPNAPEALAWAANVAALADIHDVDFSTGRGRDFNEQNAIDDAPEIPDDLVAQLEAFPF